MKSLLELENRAGTKFFIKDFNRHKFTWFLTARGKWHLYDHTVQYIPGIRPDRAKFRNIEVSYCGAFTAQVVWYTHTLHGLQPNTHKMCDKCFRRYMLLKGDIERRKRKAVVDPDVDAWYNQE